MGVASSRLRDEPTLESRSSAPKRRKPARKKQRRGFFRKVKPAPTTQPVIPVRRYPPRRYSRGFQPFLPPLLPYLPRLSAPLIYPNYMPIPYNNYATPYYMPPRQPFMFSPQQYQPMSVPPSRPMSMPQPMIIPQQLPQSSPMIIPQQVSPPMYSPYSMPYGQQPLQAQMQPIYNNIGGSTPMPMPAAGQSTPYPFSYQVATVKLSTDWTGGGKISPGFLGPPI